MILKRRNAICEYSFSHTVAMTVVLYLLCHKIKDLDIL